MIRRLMVIHYPHLCSYFPELEDFEHIEFADGATKINHLLKSKGLGDLQDRTLMLQLAMCVASHDHFRAILLKVEPEFRSQCYQALTPHLRFKAKPLDVYLMEGAILAEQMQMPTFDPKTLEVLPYKPATFDSRLHETAAEILESVLLECEMKGYLNLVCEKCTKEESIPGKTRYMAARTAAKWGWTRKDEVVRCPECSTDA
jgi:hypothetical protein